MSTTISHTLADSTTTQTFKIFSIAGIQLGIEGGDFGVYSMSPVAAGRARHESEDIPIGLSPEMVPAGRVIIEFLDEYEGLVADIDLVENQDNPLNKPVSEGTVDLTPVLAELNRVPRGLDELPRGTYRMTDEAGKIADIDLTIPPP